MKTKPFLLLVSEWVHSCVYYIHLDNNKKGSGQSFFLQIDWGSSREGFTIGTIINIGKVNKFAHKKYLSFENI